MLTNHSFEALKALIKSNRTVRRFKADHPVEPDTLCALIELARFTASGRNAQPLRYKPVTSSESMNAIFPLLAWAGYFKEWAGPEPEQRPTAYLVQCLDTRLGKDCLCDDGLQLEAITLGAAALGLGCCIIKAFNAPKLKQELQLPEHLEPRYVLALGYPDETVVIEEMDGTSEADFKYFRTTDGVHHVPKRPLSELIIS